MSISLPRDPYKVLGVPRDARLAEIRTQHRKLVLKCHPDKVQDAALKAIKQDEFQKIQQAYEILSDDIRRLQYDERFKLWELGKAMRHEKRFAESEPFVVVARKAASPFTSPRYPPRPYVEPEDEEEEEEEARRPPGGSAQADNGPDVRDSSSRIEEEIRARNAKAYERMQHGGPEKESTLNPDAKTAKAKAKLTSVPPDQLGMKVMNPERTKTSMDIIAVHGLGAIPEITWKEKHSGKNWLADLEMLPKEVPEARIMRFGYDSLWLGKEAIRTRLSTIANKLLLVLQRERKALISAKLQESSFPGILASSVGVIFLGTPHRGTKSFLPQSALLASIAAQSDLHGGIEPGVLDEMRSDNGTTLDVAEDFADLCRDLKLQIVCFFEERKSDLGKVVGRTDIQEFMVPEESAAFDGHPRYGLPLDHFSLNKFPGPDNGNFKDVCGEITRLYRIANRNLLARKPDGNPFMKAHSKPPRRNVSTSSIQRSFVQQEGEEDLIKAAVEELDQEDFEKRYQERKALEMKDNVREHREVEKLYKERLVANMKKYGVRDPEGIVNTNRLPDDGELKPQEIEDKMRWYKNRIKVTLVNRGVPGGQIDEILNDTGDTMVIDGVQMTYTRMALKWISLRTLKRYKVPYKIDEDDPSTVIIKLWVPDYEQDFLWDHTYQLRYGGSERRDTTGRNPTVKSAPSQPSPQSTRAERAPNIGAGSPSQNSARGGYDTESSHRGRNESRSFSEKHRQTSHESINAAPNPEDIVGNRRNSRTMSNERPREKPAPRKQSSYESVRSTRETRPSWKSEGETSNKKAEESSIFSGIKKTFTRSSTNANTRDSGYSEQSRMYEERPSSRRKRSSLKNSSVPSAAGKFPDDTDSDLEMASHRSPLGRRSNQMPPEPVVFANRTREASPSGSRPGLHSPNAPNVRFTRADDGSEIKYSDHRERYDRNRIVYA